MSKSAPKLPFRLLGWFCDPDILEDIEGDLLERYERHYLSKKHPNWLLFRDILLLFRPGIIRSLEGYQNLNYYSMLSNYFKITWRGLFRQKLYTSINIGGLAVGIASFLLILLYIQHEQSYDNFYPDSESIYNIFQRQVGNASMGSDYYAVTPAALGPILVDKYPEVTSATTLDYYNTLVGAKQERYLENVLFTDEFYFDVFKHTFLKGNSSYALENQTGAVVTESFALKIFGTLDVLNEAIIFWDNQEAFITGVIEDQPENASLQFSCILSIQASNYYREERVKQEWNGNSYYTFFKLIDQASPQELEQKLPAVIDEYWYKGGTPGIYIVSSMKDFHLRNYVNDDIGVKGNPSQLTMFSVIAIIVLILACVNYMNLAIARSVKRAKEVGLRKAIGAGKRQLILQFLCESSLLSLMSFGLALLILQGVIPLFGRLVERPLSMSMIYELGLIPWIFLLVFLIGIVSGSYPALFMSSLKPILVLKGKVDLKGKGSFLQRTLIILQYTVSIVMITVSLVVYQQMKFVHNKDLGFSKDQVLTIEMKSSETRKQLSTLKNLFSSNSYTSQVSFSSSLPTDVQSATFLNNDRTGGNIYRLNVDESFQSVYDLKLLAGRFLNDEMDTEEKSNFVINETAAKTLGLTARSAIGQTFMNENETKNIIGVVRDFHIHSMHIPVAPLMISVRPFRRYISIKVNPANISETLRFVEKTMADYSPFPFNYQFIDDHFDQLYRRDTQQAEIFGFFTILAILIACLGLFGMAAFTASQRTKEIGLRKVLGATMQDIVILFSKHFLFLILVAFVISAPLSWYLSGQWLQEYAYRINIAWYVYLLGGAMAMILAFATLFSQSVKVSLINPVESLKDE